MSRIILASRSPRRVELLHRIGLRFESFTPDVDERCSLPAAEAVRLLSFRKASAAARIFPDCFVIGADTLVALEDEILGKPADPADAVRMLRRLSGNTHRVFTGVTVISPDGTPYTDCDCTEVVFSSLSGDEIESYVRSGEPMDKAGAYALQGRAGMWVEKIHGSDSSVIGLPLYLVRSLLLRAGYPLISALNETN